MQNPQSQKYRCPKCGAQPGRPCLTVDGRVAGKVHYGRPDPSPRERSAFLRAEEILRTSPLRPTRSSPGIWAGSVFVSRSESVPYGVWVCSCGASREALSLLGVLEMNEEYGRHQQCRTPRPEPVPPTSGRLRSGRSR